MEAVVAEADRAVERLGERKGAWVGTGVEHRIGYLDRCITGIVEVAPEWVAEACRRRGIATDSALAGEEWISGPAATVRGFRLFADALRQQARPRYRGLRRGGNDQAIAAVFPLTPTDRLLFSGTSAEVWIEPGCEPTQGHTYRDKPQGRADDGALCLVLGAGNISSIAPLDAAYKLFVEDQVVVLKLNPVNDYLGPFLERALAPLIADGFLAILRGGREIGERLCNHPGVDTLHLTGSDRTYDAIVWGADATERERRKAAGEPLLDKPFTAELGCVTPVLVVPGRWNDAALDYQARHVASMVTHNASFNCNAAKVLVMARGWDRREAFLERLSAALAAAPPRQAYYPGASQRYAAFLEHYPDAQVLGGGGEQIVPWTLIPDVPARAGEYALCNEAFCGVLAEAPIDADGPEAFLERAVDFANDHVWGTLSCTLLIDPATRRDCEEELERALARLRYGGIGVNVWAGVVYGLGVTSWGAFPGHSREAIVSGTGVVHNGLLFDHPEKSIVHAPFVIRPKPVWFYDHRTLHRLGPALTRFYADGSLAALGRVMLAGLRG